MENIQKGCVYFFRHISLKPIKIGYTNSVSPLGRFENFKTFAPFGAEIIGFIQTDEAKKIENLLHEKYASKRLEGEWFLITEKEVLYEIDFYSSKEDIKDRNEFQIEWAKKLSNIKELSAQKTAKDYVINLYKHNKRFNKSKVAKELNITRQSIHNYINDYKKTKILW